MRNIRLQLEYEGTDFHGWQRQPGLRTVQGTLEQAASTVLRHPVETWGCARTDAGVHARGYVSNFHTESDFTTARMLSGINGCLPDDIVVTGVHEAHEDFHARFSALSRRYVYRITTVPTAVGRRFAYYSHHELDAGRMREAAGHLVGEHDFTSFTALANEANPVCSLRSLEIVEAPGGEAGRVDITVESNRFLFHMVRVIAGTLMETGRGRIEPEQMAAILRKKDRRAAGPTAAAHGLMLVGVQYKT
ncbi:MAG TPA: tRNA pseudouridine(38-40) synthase TruA [Candidatus Krumholzibacteria bacterium]|nr:tRNA pseudouridine(38-40) synthase TruA [Candidatus Krumholzibacteria bacterium]